MATATSFYSQQPPDLVTGTEESKMNKLLPHNAQKTSPAKKHRKLHGCLAAFCSFFSSEGKCQMLLREWEALRVTFEGEQLR